MHDHIAVTQTHKSDPSQHLPLLPSLPSADRTHLNVSVSDAQCNMCPCRKGDRRHLQCPLRKPSTCTTSCMLFRSTSTTWVRDATLNGASGTTVLTVLTPTNACKRTISMGMHTPMKHHFAHLSTNTSLSVANAMKCRYINQYDCTGSSGYRLFRLAGGATS